MKKNKISDKMLTAIGLVLLIAGLLIIRLCDIGNQSAPYLCVGLGCGIFGQGLGELITRRTEKGQPELAHRREIEENDERNLVLRDRAQAKAYRMMVPVFGALFFAFGLMGVSIKVVLLLVAAYLFICGCSVYYRVQFEKEM